jgi:hypothetical protein
MTPELDPPPASTASEVGGREGGREGGRREGSSFELHPGAVSRSNLHQEGRARGSDRPGRPAGRPAGRRGVALGPLPPFPCAGVEEDRGCSLPRNGNMGRNVLHKKR